MGATLYFARFVKKKSLTVGNGAQQLYEELSKIDTQGSLPGLQAMNGARAMLAEGDYNQAREKLLFITNFYSDASFAGQARNILGEMNLDQIFSPSSMKRKEAYQIKRGDSLSRISTKFNTSVEFIMAINGLSYANRIQPGQEIIVMPLEFKTLINVPKKTLTLSQNGQMIKEYPLLETAVKSRNKTISTKVEKILAYDKSSTYPSVSSKYRPNKKVVLLKAGNLQIRAVKHPDEPDPGSGAFLSSKDMEEFALLVKSGNEVEIQL